jgi:hypothetical protein
MARTTPVADQATTHPPADAPAPPADAPAADAPAADAPRRSVWLRLRQWFLDRRESFANIVIIVLLAGGAVFVYLQGPSVAASHTAAQVPAAAASACTGKKAAHPVKVNDAAGTAATLNLFVGRGGNLVQRQSAPVAVENGTLTPGTYLCTNVSDLVRSDGQTLPANQIASWARVTNDGAHVTMYVVASPRYRQVSGFGGYTGTVSLNDPRAVGASLAVDVHVEYPYLDFIILFALLAAFGGFIWARLIHVAVTRSAAVPHGFWVALVLRVAVLLATATPVLNAQVLSNPDWAGGLGQYITLATLAGGAAIALTPTLNTLLDRALTSSSSSD